MMKNLTIENFSSFYFPHSPFITILSCIIYDVAFINNWNYKNFNIFMLKNCEISTFINLTFPGVRFCDASSISKVSFIFIEVFFNEIFWTVEFLQANQGVRFLKTFTIDGISSLKKLKYDLNITFLFSMQQSMKT